MTIPFKTSPAEFNQHLLFPSNILDLLAEDHECYFYSDLFQHLDNSAVESGYSQVIWNSMPIRSYYRSIITHSPYHSIFVEGVLCPVFFQVLV